MPRGRIGVARWYSSMPWASQPAVLATAKMASPAPRIRPAAAASAASAKSMFGWGSPRRCASEMIVAGHRDLGRAGGQPPHRGQQGQRPRVAAGVDEVAEAGDPLAPAQQLADHPRRVRRAGGRVQHQLRAQRRAAVQRPAHRAEPGGHDRVRVGPHRRRDPGRHRGRGQLVVDGQHQRRLQHGRQPRRRLAPGTAAAPAAPRSTRLRTAPLFAGRPARAPPGRPGGRQSVIPAISARRR